MKLNENQRIAVTWDSGPLLVLAGPGSGKTRVLTSRIAHILEQSQNQYFRVLALTFTNKAAAEMRRRVESLVPNEFARVRLTTFHSFAAELLRQHGNHIQLRSDFSILSNDLDRQALLNDVLINLRNDFVNQIPEYYNSTNILSEISKFTELCLSHTKLEIFLKDKNIENASILTKIYLTYNKFLKQSNFLDFPTLLAQVVHLLSSFPFIINHIRKIYTHILVDEFQDTNLIQYKFLSLLANSDPTNLFVIADKDHIIYQWNGASHERIDQLYNDFNISVIQLPENYRCPPSIIAIANNLIKYNINRFSNKLPLQLFKQHTLSSNIYLHNFNNLDEEADWIVADLLKKSAEIRNNSIILAKTKKILDTVACKLEDAKIPVYNGIRKHEFQSPPLRMLHAILRLLNAQDDDRFLCHLSKSFYEIEGLMTDMPSVKSRALADGKNLLLAWIDEVIFNDKISPETFRLLTDDMNILLKSLDYASFSGRLFDWAKGNRNFSLGDEICYEEFSEECGVWEFLIDDISAKFYGEAVALHQFLHELDLNSKNPPKAPGAVPCFTIHASKGLEFGHVYLMGLVEDLLPCWAAVKASKTYGDNCLEMQEERRNCFVAITRAQESLTLTYSKNIFNWPKKPSRFLKEMGINIL
jgi:DNA helicase-2/ATP-dependent DNA helicase PcrA